MALYHTGIWFKSDPKCHRVPGPSLHGVSQFEQTVSGLWGFPNNQPAKRPKPQMATLLLDHTAAAVMAPVCSSGVAPQAHGFTLGRPHSPVSSSCFQLLLWRLLTLQNPDRCFVQCFRGEPHFSRLSKICPPSNTLHTSGASKNFSSLFLLSFVVEENGKLLTFFSASQSRGRTSSQSSWGDRLTDSQALEELRVLAKAGRRGPS